MEVFKDEFRRIAYVIRISRYMHSLRICKKLKIYIPLSKDTSNLQKYLSWFVIIIARVMTHVIQC